MAALKSWTGTYTYTNPLVPLVFDLIQQGQSSVYQIAEEDGAFKPLPPYELLLQICTDAGFENPEPLKVNHKICVALLQREKYLFSPQGLECQFVSFEEWGTLLDRLDRVCSG